MKSKIASSTIIGVGEPQDLQDDADDALEVEAVGKLQSRSGERAEDPLHQALLEMGSDVGHEILQSLHHPRHQIAEKADRVRDDVGDDAGGLREDAEEHVLEGDNLLDQPDRGIVDALPERFVLLAQPSSIADMRA